MKRLLATVTLIVCLSFPALGGHVQAGDYASCSCGTPGCIEDYPGECDGHGATQNTSSNLGSESLLVLAALILWLRLKP